MSKLGDQPAFPDIRPDLRSYETSSGMSTITWIAAHMIVDSGDWPDNLNAVSLILGHPLANHVTAPIDWFNDVCEFEAKIRVAKARALIAELEKVKP